MRFKNILKPPHLGEGYKIMPPMDKEKYPEMPGLEGPFTMMSGKVVYYDPKEGAYYDKDADMYMSYDEFQQHDNDYGDMKDERDEVKKEADELNIGAKGDRPYKAPRQPKRGDPINPKSKGVDPKVLNMFLTNSITEGEMSDLHAMISNADNPEEMVMDLVDKGGPQGQFLYSELEQLATEAGTTFNNAESLPEDFVDELLANMGIEGYTFEGVAKFYDEYDTPVKVEVTDDKILYNGNDVKMYNWSVAQSMLTPQMYKNAKSWDEVHAYLKRADDKGQLHQAIRATFETNPESITSEGKNKMGPQGIKPGDRVEHEGDMHEVIAVDGYILTVINLQTGNRTQVAMDDVTRLFGMDAMTDQDKEDAEAMFKRLKKAGSGSLKHTATEGNSPHKKGTKKYKAHMAAMHANSVDLNSMRNALKLDESTDANTVIAQYTRTTLDPSYKSWDQVKEQVNYIKSFVKESDTVNTNRVMHMLSKINLQEKTDKKLMIKEDIDKLRQIVQDKSAMSIKFKDGSMKVDMTTANIFLQAYDRMKERNQMKIQDMMQTKAGFLRVLDFIYGAMK